MAGMFIRIILNSIPNNRGLSEDKNLPEILPCEPALTCNKRDNSESFLFIFVCYRQNLLAFRVQITFIIQSLVTINPPYHPRKGVFLPEEMSDLEQLLWRLTQGGGLMAPSPPVPQHRSPVGLDLHNLLIIFCLDHSLQYLLYTYLEHYRYVTAVCYV